MKTPLPSFGLSVALVLCGSVGFSGCSFIPKRSPNQPGGRAFIKYWEPPADNTRLRLAVKDNIDVKGVVTTAGSQYFDRHGKPAVKDAPCLQIAREKGVLIVGKANLSEFAVSPSGFNEYFGTPKTPLSGWWGLLPGGSSSGSAVSVATGLADVAFGTDTAGSVRVPAAWCGVVGLKTTHGLIPLEGIFPIEADHMDTVGPLGKDVAHAVEGMKLLQRGFASKYEAAVAAQPTGRSIRVGRLRVEGTNPHIDQAVDDALTKAGFVVVPLGDEFREKWVEAKQHGNTIAAAGAWLSDRKYRLKIGISGRTKSAIIAGGIAYRNGYQEAVEEKAAWQRELDKVFRKVDFIALPTINSIPRAIPINLRIGISEAVMLRIQNTVPVNYAGNPALALPVPLKDDQVTLTSLQLIGPKKSEAALLNAGRVVEEALKKDQI